MKYFYTPLIILFSICFSNIAFSQVGINTTTPKSTLDINGNLSLKVLSLNGGPGGSATQISDGVYISLVPSGGAPEFILPNATTVPGRVYFLRNITDFDTAQVYSFGGGFYSKSSKDVVVAPLTLPPNSVNKSIIIVSDGINWTFFN